MIARESRANVALAASATAVALAITVLIKPWEGVEYHAYRDLVGVWTICYGETEGVRPGDVSTQQVCDERVLKRVENDYFKPITICIDGFTSMPISLQASLISASYNLGVRTICRSTAAQRARRGDYRGACQAISWFNRAGGKVIEGLKRRREYGDADRIGELELCLAGLK